MYIHAYIYTHIFSYLDFVIDKCPIPRSDVKNNVHYAEETQVIYPAGTNAVLWQADQKQQKIFQGLGYGRLFMSVRASCLYMYMYIHIYIYVNTYVYTYM